MALACGMVPMADGSDLGGSLRNPASFCNVVGFRPSPGRVPNWPAFNAWFPLSVAGPMARTVADVALHAERHRRPRSARADLHAEPGSVFARPLDARLRRRADRLEPRPGRAARSSPRCPRRSNARGQVFAALGCVVEEATPDLADADEIFEVLRAWQLRACPMAHYWTTHRDQLKDT